MARINVLFVCSRNQWRSPTAEAVYRKDERVSVRSRGTTRNAVQTISTVDVAWADVIFVMEQKHRNRILANFPDSTRHNSIHVLDIPDEYQFMAPELIRLVRLATGPLIDTLAQAKLQ